MKINDRKGQDILISCQNFEDNKIPSFDFHMHTNWTDGMNSVEEMYAAALQMGLRHILFSEHVRSSSESWFGDFAKTVRACQSAECQSLVGVETKIVNFQGDLDLTSNIIQQCDLIMASVHRFPGEEGIINKDTNTFKLQSIYESPIEVEFRLANLILENPNVDILGHPFGMTYKRFSLIPPRKMIIQLIKKAAKQGVAFEINSRYHPNLWELIQWCRKYNALISLGSNAHSIGEVGRIITLLKKEGACAIN